jgi:hypothetical protein
LIRKNELSLYFSKPIYPKFAALSLIFLSVFYDNVKEKVVDISPLLSLKYFSSDFFLKNFLFKNKSVTLTFLFLIFSNPFFESLI